MDEALKSSNKTTWETPPSVFDPLNQEFNFTLDPCAETHTAKCRFYFTKEQNGLHASWQNQVVFINPPYSKIKAEGAIPWIQKAFRESRGTATCVLLIPARTDTLVWHEYIFPYADEIRYIKGRIKFLDNGKEKDAAPFPTAIVVFKAQEE